MPQRYKRPGYASCGKMVLSDAKKALKIASSVKALLNVERKRFDVQISTQAIATTPVIDHMNFILQNVSGTGRNGDQVKTLGSYLTYLVKMSASAASTQFRFMLVLDKQANGANPAASDILKDVTVTDNIVSRYNLDNKYRFRILYDRVHQLSISGNQSIYVKKWIPHTIKIRFDGEAGDITDLTSSNIITLVVSSESTNTPVLTLFHRLRYVDN